jgi:hypothetical protein
MGRKRPKKVCQVVYTRTMAWLTHKDGTISQFSRACCSTKQLWSRYGGSLNIGQSTLIPFAIQVPG